MTKGIKRINEHVTAAEVVELMDFQDATRPVTPDSAQQAGLHKGRPPDPTRPSVDNTCPHSPDLTASIQIEKDRETSNGGGEHSEAEAVHGDVQMQEKSPEGSYATVLPSRSQI